ncbi:hypothetical protein ACTMTF_36490 [Nonomuraea sp. ZG12]|uniref:hypothetical protein n=1 Tax=Nonomuraea sp. ZG12 TaxID=3452207 RepID=UPI003F8C91BB
MSSDDLEAELRALAESLDVPAPPPDQVAAAVRARLDALPPHTPANARRRIRWRVVAVVVAVIVAVTAATPQGRHAVLTILRHAGVELTLTSDTPPPVATPTVLPGERAVPPGQAAAQARFPVRTLTALGPPPRVTVSDGGRVVSMFWPGGVRFDQFDGGMDPYFFKRLGPPFPQDVPVNGVTGWWLSGEHPVGYITRPDDTEIPLRQAGPTLIWQTGAVGYRLEGVTAMDRAVELARSLG